MESGSRILRSRREISLMRRAGILVWQAHQAAAQLLAPGVSTAQLEAALAKVFSDADAEPLFLNYPGVTPFPADASAISRVVTAEFASRIPYLTSIPSRFVNFCGGSVKYFARVHQSFSKRGVRMNGLGDIPHFAAHLDG